MAQFHETGYGRNFFNRQLPDLIKGINRLADNLESKEDVVLNDTSNTSTCLNCGEFKVCGNCGSSSYVVEDLLDKTVYRLCGEDVVCVLEDMGLGYISNDKEKLREMMNYVKGKLEIPWTEYLETIIDIKINTDNENLIIKLVDEMIITEEEQSITINNRLLELEWWDDGKREGVVANYFEEPPLDYSSTGVFFIDDKDWKNKFIEAIEFIIDYR